MKPRISPILSNADDANDAVIVGAPGAGTADTFSGFNVNTIALEIPISELLGSNGNKVLGAYASTSRPKAASLRKTATVTTALVSSRWLGWAIHS